MDGSNSPNINVILSTRHLSLFNLYICSFVILIRSSSNRASTMLDDSDDFNTLLYYEYYF